LPSGPPYQLRPVRRSHPAAGLRGRLHRSTAAPGQPARRQPIHEGLNVLYLYVVFGLCCLGLLIAGVIEQRNHERNLAKIPHRVPVHGLRGKSSITRLCAGALRGGGLLVVAKTTGTAARFVFPDASEEPVHRKFGIANVVEQIGIVRRAATYHPDALVIECMAVMPALQEINQTKLIRSTLRGLCNVREDHLAERGPTLDGAAPP